MSIISFNHYPREAFRFVSEALPVAMEDVYGPACPAVRTLQEFVQMHGINLEDFVEAHAAGDLNPTAESLIKQAGGIGTLDRHVDGADLCITLRRLASERWGMMARAVLESWNITSTMDFGHIVFEMVKHGALGKRPGDSIEDFKDAFNFSNFDNYKINISDL